MGFSNRTIVLYFSSSSAASSLSTSPTSLGPTTPTVDDLSSTEHTEDAAIPDESRDHAHEDVSLLTDSFRKVFDDISRLGEDGQEAKLEQHCIGSDVTRTDVSLVDKDDVREPSETDTGQQVRDDVTVSSHSDVIGGQDVISIERDEQTCNNNVRNASDQHCDDDITDGITDSQTQSLSLSSSLLIPAENAAADDTEHTPASDDVQSNINTPSQLSPGDVADESCRSGGGNVPECDYCNQTFEHQSGNNDLPPVAEETCISSYQRSDGTTQTNDLPSSYSLVTNSLDFVDQSDDYSEVERVEGGRDELNENNADELSLTENHLKNKESGSREVSVKEDSKLEAFVAALADKQSPLNEDALENSTVIESATFADDRVAFNDDSLTSPAPTYLAAEAKRMLPNADLDKLSSVSSTDSHQGTVSDGDEVEFIVVDDDETFYSSKIGNVEVPDGMCSNSVGDATRSEKMISNPLVSYSNSRVHTLDTTYTTKDENNSQENNHMSEVVCLHQLEQDGATMTTSSSSSSSLSSAEALSSSLQPPVNDDIATVQLNAFNSHQTVSPTYEQPPSNETNAKIVPRLSLSTSSPSSSVYSQMEKFEMSGSGLEEQCIQQLDRTVASVGEDTVPSDTDAKTLSRSSSSSSSSSVSSPSSSFFYSLVVSSQDVRSSESQRSAADEDVHNVNETVTDSQPDECNEFTDSRLSCSSTTGDSRDPSTTASSISHILDLERMNDDGTDTKLAEQPALTAVSVIERTKSRPSTATSLGGLERINECSLNSTGQARNVQSSDNRVSENKQQAEHKQNYVDFSRKGLLKERDDETQEEVKGECMKVRQLRPPPSQLMTPLSGDNLGRIDDGSLHMAGDAIKTESSGDVNSSRKISTLYFQPSAAKEHLLVYTVNRSNANDTSTRPMSSTVETEGCRSTAVKNSFMDNLPVASSQTKMSVVRHTCTGNKERKFVTKKSNNREAEECTSTSVEDNLVTAANNIHDSISIGVHRAAADRVGDLLPTVVETNREAVTTKSEHHHNDFKLTPASSDTKNSRSAASLVVKRVIQTPSSNNDSRFFATAAKSPTTVSVVHKQERRSAAERVAFRSSNGSSSAAPIERSDFDKSTNSSERKTNPLSVSITTINDSNFSSLEDRVRAKEKEQARRKLQSVLTPVCRSAGPVPPVVNRNVLKAKIAAELRETPSLGNVMCDSGGLLSTNDEMIHQKASRYSRQPGHYPLPSRQPTAIASQPSGFHDDNNNNKAATDRDVIKMVSPTTRRSRGDDPSSWQHRQVLYDVTISLSPTRRSFSQLSTGDDQNNQQNLIHQRSEHTRHRDVATFNTSPVDRAAVGFQRSLSLPVVDRSEAFVVPPTAGGQRDRVRLPQTDRRLYRSSTLSPPSRMKSSTTMLSTVGEYHYQLRS